MCQNKALESEVLFSPLNRHRMDGKPKALPARLCAALPICLHWDPGVPSPMWQGSFVSLSIYFMASPWRLPGGTPVNVSVSCHAILLLSGNAPKKWIGTPHPQNNWITYFHSLLTYLFTQWWPRYERPHILLRSLSPTTMNELRMLCVCTSVNLVLQNHSLGEKNHIQKSSDWMKENIAFASYILIQGSFAATERTKM